MFQFPHLFSCFWSSFQTDKGWLKEFSSPRRIDVWGFTLLVCVQIHTEQTFQIPYGDSHHMQCLQTSKDAQIQSAAPYQHQTTWRSLQDKSPRQIAVTSCHDYPLASLHIIISQKFHANHYAGICFLSFCQNSGSNRKT